MTMRRPKKLDAIWSDSATAPAHLRPALTSAQQRHGRVIPSMIANHVPALRRTLDQLRLSLSGLSNDKKGRARSVPVKDVEQAGRIHRMWTVIEGKCNQRLTRHHVCNGS
jgi:hypothetical protein